jgi:uncharacterized protein YaaN involved in tellurite resistance
MKPRPLGEGKTVSNTTSKTDALDSLLVPTADRLKQDLALIEPSDIHTEEGEDAKLEAKASAMVAELVSIDPADHERREAARGAIESLAIDAQREASRRSAMLDAPLRDLSSRAEDGGEVATSLVDLREQVEGLDPAGFDFEQGWFGRVLGKLPGIGTPIRRYFSRYESSSSVIDGIVHSLNQGKEQLGRDNITLAEDQKAMRAAGFSLEEAIKLGQLIDQKLEHQLSRDLVSDEARSKFVSEELLFPLRQRIQDLQQQLLVNQQGFLTIEMILRNNKELIRGVDRAVNVTVNALQVAVTLAMALTHQKITLEKIQAVTQTTNNLIAGTAKRLKTQGAEIQKQASSTALDIDVLKTAFNDINAALDDVSRYRQEALPMMAKSILEMDDMAKKAESSIQRAEQAQAYAGKISIGE